MEVGAAVLPARAAPAWHTTSTTVTRARDERSRRHGLRFFRWGQAAVSIVCRLQRAATLLSLALTGSHCDSLPGRYPLRGKPADRIEGDSTEPSARLRTKKKEKRRRRRRGEKRKRKKRKRKGNASGHELQLRLPPGDSAWMDLELLMRQRLNSRV